ncbi:hypothetical protein QBC45DRAFT_404469 [Copromyces sp. CBS 386.78]|nr:hypothetical protein QBC45DRAFT_404469 [Copromyces sp. CBS 386.78]
MPRPRKSRVAPSQPTVTSSSATPPVITKPTAKDPSSDIYDVSDREKERAKRAAAVAAAQRHMDSDQAKALEDQNERRDQAVDRLVNMTSTTGTEGTDENPDVANPTRTSPRAPRRLTGDTSGLDLDDDMFDLDDSLEDPTITAQKAGGYRSANTSSFDVGLFQRHRPRQNSVSGRDDGPVRPSSRGPTTPSVMSTLNLGLFKRRAREPSILGTAQKGRRQRSQSVTSQVSRIPVTDEEDNMDVDREAAIEDDDSGPDGESTPLDRTKRRSGASAFTGTASGADITIPASSGAMPVDDEELMETGSPSRRSKKRKSLESHSGRNKRGRSSVHQQPVPEPEEEENDIIHQSIEMRDGSDSPMSSPLTTPGLSPVLDPMQSSPPRQSRPPLDPNDPVNAPPASDSSEAGSPVAWPSLNNLTHRSYNTRRAAPVYTERLQTPELLPGLGAGPVAGALDADMSSELSSPPSLTHSPNYKAPRIAKASAAAAAATKKAAGAPKKREEEKLATETLTSLLPARRNHAKPNKKHKKGRNKEDPYDLSSDEGTSSSEEDETTADGDELSYVATAAVRKKKKKTLAAEKQKRKEKEKEKEKHKENKPLLGTSTNGKVAAGKSKASSSEPKRTYGRATGSSDKENADGIVAGGSGDNEEDGEGDDNDDQEAVSAMDLDEAEELPETTQMMTERLGEELQKAAKKFKEVDKWELSFEEVTQPSSPVPDAR